MRLYRLQLATARADGDSYRRPIGYYRRILDELDLDNDSICAVDEYGHFAVVGRVRYENHLEHEQRAYLNGIVHPDHRSRGLGHFVLNWMIVRARRVLTEDPRPGVLRIDVYDTLRGAVSLYEHNGFSEAFSVDEMVHPLGDDLPENPLPDAVDVNPWDAKLADAFFTVYEESFSERDDFPDWPQETWVTNMTGMEEFRPDLSLLLKEGDKPVAFAICAASMDDQQQPVGRVLQLGVVPAARRQRLGQALLSHLLTCFKDEDFSKVLIEMRSGDTGAEHFLTGMGFSFLRSRITYEKRL